jgi:hypothetical protein
MTPAHSTIFDSASQKGDPDPQEPRELPAAQWLGYGLNMTTVSPMNIDAVREKTSRQHVPIA